MKSEHLHIRLSPQEKKLILGKAKKLRIKSAQLLILLAEFSHLIWSDLQAAIINKNK